MASNEQKIKLLEAQIKRLLDLKSKVSQVARHHAGIGGQKARLLKKNDTYEGTSASFLRAMYHNHWLRESKTTERAIQRQLRRLSKKIKRFGAVPSNERTAPKAKAAAKRKLSDALEEALPTGTSAGYTNAGFIAFGSVEAPDSTALELSADLTNLYNSLLGEDQ